MYHTELYRHLLGPVPNEATSPLADRVLVNSEFKRNITVVLHSSAAQDDAHSQCESLRVFARRRYLF